MSQHPLWKLSIQAEEIKSDQLRDKGRKNTYQDKAKTRLAGPKNKAKATQGNTKEEIVKRTVLGDQVHANTTIWDDKPVVRLLLNLGQAQDQIVTTTPQEAHNHELCPLH